MLQDLFVGHLQENIISITKQNMTHSFLHTLVLIQHLSVSEKLKPSTRIWTGAPNNSKRHDFGSHCAQQGSRSTADVPEGKGNRCRYGETRISAQWSCSTLLVLYGVIYGITTTLWGGVVVQLLLVSVIVCWLQALKCSEGGIKDTKWGKTIHRSLISLRG